MSREQVRAANLERSRRAMNRPLNIDPAWRRYQLAFDLSGGQHEKIAVMMRMPLFRIAMGERIEVVAREAA